RARGDRPRPLTSAPMNERILVVDDTPANIQTVAAILKGKGYQLSVATNGKQALDALTKIRPDLILLDVMMPELDGFETCQRIKSSEAWRDIPVIFLTAKTDTADIVKGFEMGATILVSDLRGFTAMAERLAPRDVIEVLNLYLETMVDVIGRYEGTIDEIIGDAILVIFGAPVACSDHAAKAVACGLAMQLA